MNKEQRIAFLKGVIAEFGDKAPSVIALLTERNARTVKAARRDAELNGLMKQRLSESGLPAAEIKAGLAALSTPEYEILEK